MEQEHAIEKINAQRQLFSHEKTDILSRYLEQDKKTTVRDRLVIMNGWANVYMATTDHMPLHMQHLLLNDQLHTNTRCGGYWVQLDGTGIVINPGKWFLQRFHQAGFHIWDIDHIIVTDGVKASTYDLEDVWAFNKHINTMLQKWNLEPHIISYWLHPKAYEKYAAIIRPQFRQEACSIHRLETFVDSHSYESIQFTSSIYLNFASNGPNQALMIKLISQEETKVGFLTNASSNQYQKEFFSDCSICIFGIGKTTDTQSCLGLSGISTILQNHSLCKLAIISEYDFSDGDTRIETLHFLRDEIAQEHPALVPAENGLTVYLDAYHIKTNDLLVPTSPYSVKSSRSRGPFSKLQFFDELGIF